MVWGDFFPLYYVESMDYFWQILTQSGRYLGLEDLATLAFCGGLSRNDVFSLSQKWGERKIKSTLHSL